MTLLEAIVYVLASSNRGMRTEQIAEFINTKGLFHRKGGVPVDSKMVYAAIMSHPEIFVKSDGLIRLLI
jgi:hypothetical protein